MFQSRMSVVILIILGVGTLAVLLPYIFKLRNASNRTRCLKNFQELGEFSARYVKKPSDWAGTMIPAGTIPHPTLPPDQRLSWVITAMPLMHSRTNSELAGKFQLSEGWQSPANFALVQTRLRVLTCPGAEVDSPSYTQIVGLTGVGTDSGALPIGTGINPRAGCFRLDSPTPLELIQKNDGLSHTLMFAETSYQLGPWSQGGMSTLRGLNTDANAPPILGPDSQFGGHYMGVTAFGLADGSARFFLNSTSRLVIQNMMTIAGNEFDINEID